MSTFAMSINRKYQQSLYTAIGQPIHQKVPANFNKDNLKQSSAIITH